MSKIIIHNETDSQTDLFCMRLVYSVVSNGFISGEKQYCWLTVYHDKWNVIAMKTRGETFTFKVRSK